METLNMEMDADLYLNTALATFNFDVLFSSEF